MKLRALALVLTYCTFFNVAIAQNNPQLHITVGQQCPDVKLQMVNYKTPTAKISDFKGKLLIIDFWATWCQPCRFFLEHKVEELKKKFGDRIEILAVSDESAVPVLDYIKDLKKAKGIDIYSVIEDKQLKSLYPHTYIPHEIWLDGDQKVIAITNESQVNEENVNKILNGDQAKLNIKIDPKFLNVDDRKPLLTGNQGLIIPDSLILFKEFNKDYKIMLTRYINVLGSGAAQTPFFFNNTNESLAQIYKWILNCTTGDYTYALGRSRVIFDLDEKDHSKIDWPNVHAPDKELIDWENAPNHRFCFEFAIADTSNLTMKKINPEIILHTIDNYLKSINISASLEVRDNEVYRLKKINNEDKIKTKGGEEKKDITAYGISFRNEVFGLFFFRELYFLQNSKIPLLIDKDLYQEKVDMDLTCDMSDVNSVNKALAAYGLQFVKQKENLKYLVFKSSN